MPINLRGQGQLYGVLCIGAFLGYGALMMNMTVVGKMIADVSDEHELRTGARQEGLLFSASMFLGKTASGLGTLVSGLIIKVAAFPERATPEAVDPAVVSNLGLGSALGSICFGLLTYLFYSRFQLSTAQHGAIASALAERRTSDGQRANQPSQAAEGQSSGDVARIVEAVESGGDRQVVVARRGDAQRCGRTLGDSAVVALQRSAAGGLCSGAA
jgi:Na+/melibiose symporter-like transporter